MNTVYLSKDLAMERVSSFLSRWKNSTDQGIDFDLAKSSEIIEDASELLRKVPREVQKIGCYCLAFQRKVVVWLLTAESGHGSGDEERRHNFLQIVLQKPPEFGSAPVEIKYNVMSNSADRNNNVCLCGIEISYGNILILSPPATGEMVISISRIELAKELS